MSGVLRLGNTGAGTGRSTLEASASNDQTFTLPSAGGTLLTSNTSIPGGTITLDGATVNITNGDLNVDSGTLFVDESNNRVGIGTTIPSTKLHISGASGIALRLDGANAYSSIADILLNQDRARIRAQIDPSGGDPGGSLILATRNTTAAFINALTIDNSANITIGTGGASLFFQNGFNNATSRIQNAGSSNNANMRFFTTLSNTQTERIRIEADGDTLIGNPASFTSAGILNVQTDGNKTISFNAAQGELANCASLSARNDNASALVPFGMRASELRFATGTGSQATNQRMTIDSNGRVLIGNISSLTQYASQSYIQVAGQEFDNSTITLRRDQNNSNPPGIIFAKSRSASLGGNTIVQDDDQIGTLIFCPADGNDLRNRAAEIKVEMDGAVSTDQVPGRIVFRTTSPGNSAPTTRLTMESNGALTLEQNAAYLRGQTQTGYIVPIQIQNTGNNTQATLQEFTGWNGTVIGAITGFVNQTNYVTSSDYRLKENTVKVTDGIKRIKQLQPKSFNFLENPDLTLDGFFAHEVQEIVPNAVTGKHNEVDEEGKPVYQGMDHSKLVPLLTAALQETIAKVEALEAEVSKLRSN